MGRSLPCELADVAAKPLSVMSRTCREWSTPYSSGRGPLQHRRQTSIKRAPGNLETCLEEDLGQQSLPEVVAAQVEVGEQQLFTQRGGERA